MDKMDYNRERQIKLKEVCKEWLNSNISSEDNFSKRFYELLYKPSFPYFTFTHEFRVGRKHEFEIKLTKYPFLKPKIDITLYDVNDKRRTFNRLETYSVVIN